jgi:hypothetical protein
VSKVSKFIKQRLHFEQNFIKRTTKRLKSYDKEFLSRANMSEWQKRFIEVRKSVQDDERVGRPSIFRNEESNEVSQKCLVEDRILSVQMSEEIAGINREGVREILGLSFRNVGPGILCTTMHKNVLRDFGETRDLRANPSTLLHQFSSG